MAIKYRQKLGPKLFSIRKKESRKKNSLNSASDTGSKVDLRTIKKVSRKKSSLNSASDAGSNDENAVKSALTAAKAVLNKRDARIKKEREAARASLEDMKKTVEIDNSDFSFYLKEMGFSSLITRASSTLS